MLEAKVCIAHLMHHFQFTPDPTHKVVPEIRITLRPKYGLFLNVAKR